MLYALFGEDHPDSLHQRLASRPEHLHRLQALQDEGKLVLAGPFPSIDAINPGSAGFSGSLIVAEFDTLEAAQAWLEADPYVTNGIFSNTWVKPFRKVFPQ